MPTLASKFLTPELLASITQATAIKDAPLEPYNPDTARKENGGKLPTKRAEQFIQPATQKHRQILDDKGNLLADISFSDHKIDEVIPALVISVNDKALKITNTDGQITLSGRDGLKIQEVQTTNDGAAKITPRAKLFDDKEITSVSRLRLNMPNGSKAVIGRGGLGKKVEFLTGSVDVTIEAKEGKEAIPKVYLLDRKAEYNAVINNLPETKDVSGEKLRNLIDAGQEIIIIPPQDLVRIKDQGNNVDMSMAAATVSIGFKTDNREVVMLPIIKERKALEAWSENREDPKAPKSFQGLATHLNETMIEARQSAFETTQLPTKPASDKTKDR